MQVENQISGTNTQSWAFYKHLAEKVYSGSEQSFGYFVFDPDVVAYQTKYALMYQQRLSKKSGRYFQKENVTYLVIAINLYHEETFWTNNLLHITKQPSQTTKFDNGYRIEKYLLSDEEKKIPVEPNIDPGLMFR
jgi:hypothetical protein